MISKLYAKNGQIISKCYINLLFNGFFRLCPPYDMSPKLHSTCNYTVNHYVRIWRVRPGVANNMHHYAGGGTNEKDPPSSLSR